MGPSESLVLWFTACWLCSALLLSFSLVSYVVNLFNKKLKESKDKKKKLNELLDTGSYRRINMELRDIAESCSEHGWDGENAAPIPRDSIELCKKFLAALPYAIYLHNLSVYPTTHGFVKLEWEGQSDEDRSKIKVVTIWMDARKKGIYYNTYTKIGEDIVNDSVGNFYFKNRIPLFILDKIREPIRLTKMYVNINGSLTYI